MENRHGLQNRSVFGKNSGLQIFLISLNLICLVLGILVNEFDIVASLVLLQFLSGILALLVRGYKVLSFPVMFYIVCYVFHGSYLFLMLFNQRAGNLYMFRESLSSDTHLLVGKFILLFFGFLLLGLTSLSAKQKILKNHKPILSLEQIRIIGAYVFWMCLLPRLYVDFKFIFEFLATGEYRTMDSVNNYLLILADGFYVGGILLIIGNKNNSKKAISVLVSCFLVLAISMISGNRGIKVAYFLALTVFYFSFVVREKMKTSNMVKYIILGYLFLTLIATFGDLRELGTFSLSLFLEVFFKNISYKMIFDQLGEFGYAAFTLGAAMETFGQGGYLGGKIYLLSWAQVIPNIAGLLDGFADSLNYVMMLPSKYQYSLGGSLLGEYFANFGYFSFVYAYFLGVFIKNAYKKMERAIETNSISIFTLLVILAVPKSFIWIRSVFNEFPRSVIWYFVLILVLKVFVFRKKVDVE